VSSAYSSSNTKADSKYESSFGWDGSFKGESKQDSSSAPLRSSEVIRGSTLVTTAIQQLEGELGDVGSYLKNSCKQSRHVRDDASNSSTGVHSLTLCILSGQSNRCILFM
jgi:hypothetical protein